MSKCECSLISCFHDDDKCNNVALVKLIFNKGSRFIEKYVCAGCYIEYIKAQCPESGITMFASHILEKTQ
jgi:hypothetical protein